MTGGTRGAKSGTTTRAKAAAAARGAGGRPLVVTDPHALRAALDELRRKGRSIAFVPTMGALHEGHLELVRHARAVAGVVVVSIFVNPTQFGPHEDLARYPRDLDGDVRLLATVPADFVLFPPVESVYPPGHATTVHVAGLGDGLCGPHRPGHFDGVATVVAKLFSMVGPCTAVFGRKDFQQLQVIRRMAADLDLPVRVVGRPTVREPDGLAMSSRNRYLSPGDRLRATALVEGLRAAAAAFGSGERDPAAIEQTIRERLAGRVDRIDYVFVGDPGTLQPWPGAVPPGRTAVAAIAAFVGTTRLIDNVELGAETI
ncbi:MAG: pantoate--beta-alanine ligase [Deltaproteobacteria bacterium]|nr:pantoate--beta-alanine ligase [Deltaproteobacteria bacterium]